MSRELVGIFLSVLIAVYLIYCTIVTYFALKRIGTFALKKYIFYLCFVTWVASIILLVSISTGKGLPYILALPLLIMITTLPWKFFWEGVVRAEPIKWSSNAKIFGLPILSIAIGPCTDPYESPCWAKGIIAIGDRAMGVVALSINLAVGLISFGGISLGLISYGGVALGLFTFGGLSIGLIAVGGLAIGMAAIGGGALGYYVIGGETLGKFIVSATEHSEQAIDFFSRYLRWLLPPYLK